MLPLLTLLAALQASPAPSPTENPSVTKTAQTELTAWEAGKPDWSHYIAPIPDATVKQVQAFLATLGAVKSVSFVQTVQPQGVPVPLTVYSVKGESANAYLLIHIDAAGKIDEIFFKPAP